MLEEFFIKPSTIDRLRSSWIAPEIEAYVVWLTNEGFSTKCVWRRVPIVFAFGEFGRAHGAETVAELPSHVEAFVAERTAEHHRRARSTRPMAKEVRGPIEQLLSVVLPGFEATGRRPHAQPFANALPDFFGYLTEERGLRPTSVRQYTHHLDRFEAYLSRIGVGSIRALAGDPERLHRRTRWLGPRKEHRPGQRRSVTGIPALRPSGGGSRGRSFRRRRLAPGLPALQHPPLDLLG